MTQSQRPSLPAIFLDGEAVVAAIQNGQRCPDCRPNGIALIVQATDWGVYTRHSDTCPSLTPAQRAQAAAWWNDFYRTTRSGNRPADLPPSGTDGDDR